MIEKSVLDNNNKQYIIKVDEDNFNTEIIDNRPRLIVKFEVWERDGGRVGHGNFSYSCRKEHKHISEDQALNILINMGVAKIKKDINNDNNIESKGYFFDIIDCAK